MASRPHVSPSSEAQDELIDAISQLLAEAQSIGVQHGQQMVGKQERGLIGGLRNVVSWAKDIVSGMMDRIESAIDDALGSYDDTGLSQSEIVDATMRDLIEQTPDLVAETEVQDAVEGAVVNSLQKAGARTMRWVTEPGACEMCQQLADQDPIDVNGEFEGGLTNPPAHPRCRCSISVEESA